MVGSNRRRRPLGFAWRLMVSLGLVVVAGGVTLLSVALLIAPRSFHVHLAQAGIAIEPGVQAHVDEAFATAIIASLGVALPIALLTALAVTWVVAQRLGRSVATLATAAERIAQGNLHARVIVPAIGPEFSQLASAFNSMAERLSETETTRRRLIGDLAHELRTPLASLEATVEAVADGVLPMDDATLSTLIDQTGRLQHLVADMAAVSKAEERQLDLHPQLVELAVEAERAGASARARFESAGVRLSVDVDPDRDGPTGWVDPERLAEVLANLLDNALRHTAAGSAARIEVGGNGHNSWLEVSDTGEGFDPAAAERIFERFYRIDSSRTRTSAGSGVGLTIARAIVEAHDGTLTASSEGPGTGATFRVHLLGTIPAAPSRR